MVQEKTFVSVFEGTTLAIGEPAYLLCKNRETGLLDLIETSPVENYFQGMDGKLEVKTRNSVYRN